MNDISKNVLITAASVGGAIALTYGVLQLMIEKEYNPLWNGYRLVEDEEEKKRAIDRFNSGGFIQLSYDSKVYANDNLPEPQRYKFTLN